MGEFLEGLLMFLGIIAVICTFVGSISAGIYYHKSLEVENFQITISELNNEQKCLHICGFQFPSTTYFDNYKFCVEKCDRISERENTNCNIS